MLRALALRLEDRNFLTLVKLAEVKLLGRYASTYCYNSPSHVLLELTARCNLKCIWCVQNNDQFSQTNQEDMSFELFQEIVPKLKGAKVLYLHMNGEPLLYNRIFEAIELAKRYVPNVRFVTNGILLSREVSKGLKAAGLTQLGISIDSTDEEEMFKIRNVSLEKISENVRLFSEITGIPVEVRAVICGENIESLKRLPDYATQFRTCHLLYFTLAEGIRELEVSPMTMLKSKSKFRDLKEIVVLRCKELGLYTNLEYMRFYDDGFLNHKRKGRCDSLFGRQLAINNKGYIMPCCTYWGHHLDNLGEVSFNDAWNGKRTREWRKSMLKAEYTSHCSNCCGYPEAS